MTILNKLLTIKKQADEVEASYINDQLSDIGSVVSSKVKSIDTSIASLRNYSDYKNEIVQKYRDFRFPDVPYAHSDLSELLEDSPVSFFLDETVTQDNLQDIQSVLVKAKEKIEDYKDAFTDLPSKRNTDIKNLLQNNLILVSSILERENKKLGSAKNKEKEAFKITIDGFIKEIQRLNQTEISKEIAKYLANKKNGTPNDFTEENLKFKLVGRDNISSKIKPKLIGLLQKKIQNYNTMVDEIYLVLEQKLSEAEQMLAKYQQDYQNIPEDGEITIKDFEQKKQETDIKLRGVSNKIISKEKEIENFITQQYEQQQQNIRQQEQYQLIKKNVKTAIGLALGEWSSYISDVPVDMQETFKEYCQKQQKHFLSAEVSPLSEPEYQSIRESYKGGRNLTEDEKNKLFKNVYQRIVNNVEVSSENSSLDISRLSSSGSPTNSASDISDETFEIDSDSSDSLDTAPKFSVNTRSAKQDLAFAGALLVSSTFTGAAGAILGAVIGTLIAPGPGTVLGLAAGAGLSGLTTGSVLGGLFGLFSNRNKKPKEKGYQPLAQDDSQSDHRKKPGNK